MIKVWYKKPKEIGRCLWIHNQLHALQELVDGPIEVVRLSDPKHVVLVNEEALLRGDMHLNMIVGPHFLFGPLVVIGVNEDEFTDCSLDAAQVRKLLAKQGGAIHG